MAFLALTFARFIIKKKHLEAVSTDRTARRPALYRGSKVWGVRASPIIDLRGSFQGSLRP